MKVYVVWYLSELDKAAHMWGLYRTQETAENEVKELQGENRQYSAWWTEEEVQG